MMRTLLLGAVKAYRLLFAWLPPSCRYYPSCSGYAVEALQMHGALAGSYLAVRRICRCVPWCDGGDDPVPLEKPRLFTHLLSPFSQKNNT